ncbi:hypothetical protein OIDMADRAFT_162663 [Oidiodendron maius Zn]|uniref:NGG1p interacting factor 3 n=1 Tax=Oidiodendron maius (strain Zn) TaxID=913774 RepID=A0A0C3GXN5_OIDMZ|nr:hypothetical protein OIDMADRAFT_162663 [Oidiodendron maius Zn]
MSISAMSSSATQASPFTRAVIRAVRKLYPESLADKSFDNTGLLLEAPYRPGHLKNSALLTIDLTKAVADEAIARKDSIIITYHPIIFRALKSITLGNSQQSTLLRLAQEGISVYSPHTAVDAAPGGLIDWLADILVHDRSSITPIKEAPPGFNGAGYGRIVRFQAPLLLGTISERIQNLLGNLSGLSIAVPQTIQPKHKPLIKISSVGICAGSGGSLLNGLDVDLLFTGELSHHEALAAIEQGKCVITTFHSNTEREFLKRKMQPALEAELKSMAKEEDAKEFGLGGDFQIAVSEVDKDPFEFVMRHDAGWYLKT